MHELRTALRRLLQNPGHTLLAVVVLALGIGSATATFSLLDAVLLADLPLAEPDELVRIREVRKLAPDQVVETSHVFLQAWQEGLDTLDVAAYATTAGGELVDFDGPGPQAPEQIGGRRVTGRFFDVLGTPAVAGRLLRPEDDRTGAPPVAVLREDLFRERFPLAEGLGQRITVAGIEHTVIGLVGRGVDVPVGSRIWVALAPTIDPMFIENWAIGFLNPIARLGGGTTAVHMERELGELIDREANPLRPDAQHTRPQITPLRTELVGQARLPLGLLLVGGMLVLAVACANVASLQLARGYARLGDLATRRALGASNRSLVWALSSEALLLGVAGAFGGLLVAHLLLTTFVQGSGAASEVLDLFRLDLARLDPQGVGFAALTGVLAIVVAALLPAVSLLRRGRLPGRIAGSSTRQTAGADHHRSKARIVVAQVALATLLLLSAGLVVRSFAALRAVDTGYDRDVLWTASVSFGGTSTEAPENHRQFKRLLDELEGLPEIDALGAMLIRPLEGVDGYDYPFFIEGRSELFAENRPVNYQAITPGTFEALGLDLLSGRRFDHRDHADASLSVIVSRSFAQRYFGQEDPVGHRLSLGSPEWEPPSVEIVGVVEDARYRSLENSLEDIYVPYEQSPWPLGFLLARTSSPESLGTAIAARARRVDPDVALLDPLTGTALFSQRLARPRFLGQLISLFAGLALLLAIVGLFGLMTQHVTERRSELALRLAVGAAPRDLSSGLLAQSLRATTLGAIVGLGAYFAVQTLVASRLDEFLYVPRLGVGSAVLLVALLLLAGVVGVIGPVRRASRLDPSQLLR